MTDDLEARITPMVYQATRDLMFRTREALHGDFTKQIKVGISVMVGGKVFEHSLRSPALEGDDFIPQKERPDLTT